MMIGNLGKKVCFLVAVTLFPLLLTGITVCEAAEQLKVKTLKWAFFMPEADYNSQTLRQFRDDIETFTNGSIKPTLYWVGEMAETKDLPDLCRRGAIEMTTTAPVIYQSIFPLNSTLTAFPLIFKRPEQAAYTWVGLLRDMPEIQGEYAKLNQYCLNRSTIGMYLTLSKKPIRNLADLKGVKIRPVGGKHLSNLMVQVGAVPVYLPVAEIYEGLMRGVLDAVMLNPQALDTLRLYEAAKYVSLPFGTIVGFHISINLDVWNSLTPEIKKAFTRAAIEWGARDLQLQTSSEDKSIESLKRKGVQFTEFDQKDLETLIAKGGDLWVAARENLVKDLRVDGPVADRFIRRWRELTDEYERTYASTGKKWKYNWGN